MRPLRRAALVVFIACVAMTGIAVPAGAGEFAGASSGPDKPRVGVATRSGERPAHHRSPYSSCLRESLILTGLADGLSDFLHRDVSVETTASLAWLTCTRVDNGTTDSFLAGLNFGGPAVDLLVTAAQKQLTIALPTVATAPPQGGLQLVGVDVWFWITNNTPASATARVPGLAATITARPRRTRLRFDDGTTIDCAGSGTSYDPAVDYTRQSSDCTHIFQDPGRQSVDVTITWDLTWTATNGQAGALPGVDRTTTVILPLRQAQAVTD